MGVKFRGASVAVGLCLILPVLLANTEKADEVAHEATVASQASEGLNLAGGVKAAITEFFHMHERFPESNAEAGLVEPFEIKGKFVVSITVNSGVISIEYGADSHPAISGRSIEMTPSISESKLTWTCSSRYIESIYLPVSCR